MNEINLTINGMAVKGREGQTILDIARAHGVDIPTLCHDGRVETSGACGLCVVEAEGNPRLLRACSTVAADGMNIQTESERIVQNRKTALELLLSDHTGDCRAPCVLACPAETDCQGYIKLIAEGKYQDAYALMMEKLPLPASIGRVCPHPCEEACRRELVEEPVSIMALKQFVGDMDHAEPAGPGASTGKTAAVIGGGPGGLTAAYFLRKQGHSVTVYDAMPQMGGMLRYGIPEYRLPKAVLQKEIDIIGRMGVTFRNNVKIGRDIALDTLRGDYDAVIAAVGAWTSVALGCPGEECALGGIEFLRAPADVKGKRVAIVGGGNTAMDACRTAVRLGAETVYNIYRRTKHEMPADPIEIAEAEEEGILFKNLTNPIEILHVNGQPKAIRLQVMELGEPDGSGRRSPVPVPGKEETVDVDTVIIAIGQKPDVSGLEGLALTKRGTVAADEGTFLTNMDGVFAAGDATNKGADIAIAAIGEGRRAAEMAGRYLNGETLRSGTPYLSKTEKAAADFVDREKRSRIKTACRPASERRNDFSEIGPGLTEEEARREASRCLECGCPDYFECKLVDYAGRYPVRPEKYAGAVHRRAAAGDVPGVLRTPDKCVLCGLCVRLCEEEVGAGVLGFVRRGFDTTVQPAGDCEACADCGKCAEICPTGALLKQP